MKKQQIKNLRLNKSNISSLKINHVVGGGETYPCPHTIGTTCTSTLPGSIINCNPQPSVFGGGVCTTATPYK